VASIAGRLSQKDLSPLVRSPSGSTPIGSIDPRFGSPNLPPGSAEKSISDIVSGMEVYMFLLVLGHVIVLFASAIALALFIVVRLSKWLWRICTAKSSARKSAKQPQKKYLSPLSETALH
jgi:hypothetical protein